MIAPVDNLNGNSAQKVLLEQSELDLLNQSSEIIGRPVIEPS